MTDFAGKTLMITGGTGSFGNTVLKHFVNTDFEEIRIFSARREEAGRHAPPPAGEEPRARLQGAVLHRRRSRRPVRARRDARRGLHLPRRGPEAGPILRVLPHGGRAHQRHRHRQRAARRHRRGRGEGRVPLHRQGGLPHQRHGQVEGQ